MKSKPPRRNAAALRAALYARHSTEEQSQQAVTSCDSQEAETLAYATARGYRIAAMIRDEGRSGTTHQRPGLRRLVALAESREIDVVVVTRMDRLGRGKVFIEAQRDLYRAGVGVEMVLEQFQPGLGGYMEEQMRLLVGGMYAPIIAEHTRAKMRDMARRGLWIGGRPPIWLRVETVGEGQSATRQPRLDPEGLSIVRDAFALFLSSESRERVRVFLVEATGRGWEPHQVAELLAHPLAVGTLRWGELTVEGYAPAPIDPATFAAAQALLARTSTQRKGTPRSRRETPPSPDLEPWWFQGSFVCGQCGAAMTPYFSTSRGREYRYYECTNQRRGLCDQPRLSAPRVHALVLDATFAAVETPWQIRSTLEAAAGRDVDREALDREARRAMRARKAAQERARSIRLAIGACRDTGAIAALAQDLEAALSAETQAGEDLERARAAQREAKAPTAEQLYDVLSRARELWRYATEEEKREMVRLLIGEMVATGRRVTWLLRLCHPGAPFRVQANDTLPTRLLLETSRPSVPLSGTVAATGRVARRGGW